MFTKSARFYDTLYAFKDYSAASAQLLELIGHRLPRAASLLDVGCGTGRHLESFARHLRVEGLDLDPVLLGVARQRLPDVPLHQADMSRFDLGRRFDIVTCLFSAIGYVRTVANMRLAVAAMAHHLEPGGLLIVEPWFVPEQYRTGTITANVVDEPDLKIAWMYTSERVDNISLLDIHYMVGTPGGVEEFTEQHRIGLFTREEYLAAFADAGLEAEFDPHGLFRRGLYVAQLEMP